MSTYSIPSKSLLPTLRVGDHFVAWKDYYRDHAPQRGEIAVFKLPSDPSKDYISRIVGLPGDLIQVKGGILHINGKPVKRRKVAEYRYREGFLFINAESASSEQLARFLDMFAGPTPIPPQVTEYIETFANGNQHRIFEARGDDPRSDDTRVYTVPPGHFFVMGDNRDASNDSRFSVGFVPRNNLRGRPTIIIWAEAWSRVGTMVQPTP